MRELTFAHSPDADDLYMVAPLALGWLDGAMEEAGIAFRFVEGDISDLNEQAALGLYDVTALSFAAYLEVRGSYLLLDAGSSAQEGRGPVLVASRKLALSELQDGPVAIPGVRTTSRLALDRWMPGLRWTVLPFRRIAEAVLAGEVVAGVLIDESQQDYQDRGLVRVVDFGAWWKEAYDLPLPMGGVAIRSELPLDLQRGVLRLFRASIEMALARHPEVMVWVQDRCPGVPPALLERHARAWVNGFSVSLGDRGRRAVAFLLGEAPAWVVP